MTDVSLALQAAIIAALKIDTGVTAIVGERVYDRVPENARFPYVKYGDHQLLPDDADCIEGFETFETLHAWSRAVGQVEAKRLCAAVHGALHNADLTIAGHRLHVLEHRDTRIFDDPDGVTTHGVITFRVLLDPA